MDNTPEKKIRSVVDQCADCEQCREMMAEVCPFFPKLYQLFDREKDESMPITSTDLRELAELCNFCGLCPCPEIRSRILQAKSGFVRIEGMPLGAKLIQDVDRAAKYLSRFPGLVNTLIKSRACSSLFKKILGIHTERSLPEIPADDFPARAKKTGLCKKHPDNHVHVEKVAYFAGCASRYFFPEVAKATVRVLRKNRVTVYYPPQKCCSMPALVEGDASLSLELAGYNLKHMTEILESGYDLVCSCPTCGYMFKKMIREKAFYSSEYQESAGGDETSMVIPVEDDYSQSNRRKHHRVHRSLYAGLMKDDGIFSSLNPLARIKVAQRTFDLGQYLMCLRDAGKMNTAFAPVSKKIAYYPPCHTREQNTGLPYARLLALIPGLDLRVVEGSYLCCGMGGIMGLKRKFHKTFLEIAGPLLQKIREMKPDVLVTECLSCRMQFDHALPFAQAHPVEILAETYGS